MSKLLISLKMDTFLIKHLSYYCSNWEICCEIFVALLYQLKKKLIPIRRKIFFFNLIL